MTDADVKLLIDTLSAAVAAGQKVSVPAERVLELHARLLVAQMEVGEVERAARAAAFREAAELCDRWADKWRPDVPVRDRYADGLSSGASEIADALRARGEGGEG